MSDTEEQVAPIRQEMTRLAESHARTIRRAKLYERVFHRFTAPEMLEENLTDVLDGLMEATSTEAGSVALLDPEKEDIYFPVARGPVAEKVMKLRIERGRGIISQRLLKRADGQGRTAVAEVADEPAPDPAPAEAAVVEGEEEDKPKIVRGFQF